MSMLVGAVLWLGVAGRSGLAGCGMFKKEALRAAKGAARDAAAIEARRR